MPSEAKSALKGVLPLLRPRLVLFFVAMSSFGAAHAANRYWVASLFSNWNNTLNWSATSGGLPLASVPGAGDVAIFDNGSSVSCTIDAAVNVSGITVNSTYTGAISQGANSITVSGAATFSGGTFTGGTANFTVSGIFTLSGTAFRSTSGILELQSNAAFTSGSFAHNNGMVRLNATGSPAITGTSPSLYGLEIVGNNTTYSLSSTGNIAVANLMKISGTGNATINTGSINLTGNLTLTNTATGGGGTASINIAGNGAQTADGTAVTLNQSRLPLLTINKPSGTLTLAGNLSFASNVTYTAGTVSPGTSTCYIVNNLTITGSFPVNNFTIAAAGGETLTVAAGSTVTVTGTLDLENGANLININTGTIAAQGNIIDNNTNTGGGGTGLLLINGTGAQNMASTGVIYQGILPAVTINKASGVLTLPSLITERSNWTYLAGTLDVTTNNSMVVFGNSLTISGNHTLNNVDFDGGGNYTYSLAGTNLAVSGNMSMSGTGNLILNNGTINLTGNLLLTNTATAGTGSTVITFVAPVNQSIVSALTINQCNLPSVNINKPSGTLSLPALITVRGNWTYTAGTLDATTNGSTVVFANTLTIAGTHTLNNVNFEGNFNNSYTVSTGTVLTVAGTLTTSGSSNVVLSTPVAGANGIQAQGDVILNNTAAASGGTGGLLINGTGNQALTGNAASGQGQLPFVTIQKTSGTLTMGGTITVTRNWLWSAGTVNPSTSTVVFGGNNLSVTSAGMNFNHVTVAANTISLGNSLTAGGNLTISGAGVLAAGANTINLAGNWANWGPAGFTSGTSTVNLNGAALQTVADPGGENYYSLTVNNTGGGVQLVNPVAVANLLTMSQGNINLNGNNLTLGTAAASPGTLAYTAGTMTGIGSFTRWYAAATMPDLSAAGLFPMGTAANYRPFYITAPGSAPTTGGTLAVAYNDASTKTAVSIPDGASTIQIRDDLNWAVTAGGGLAGGTYDLDAQGTGFGTVGSVADLRLSLASSVTGTAGANGGIVSNPQVNRTGVTAANLTNSFFVGSVNLISTPLPVTLVYFTAQAMNGEVELNWETSTETNNDYFMIERSADGVGWKDMSRVDGHGNTGNAESYVCVDQAPLRGVSYYRLMQVDQDGHPTYSGVVSVNIGIPTVSVYPNPAIDQLVVTGSAVTGVSLPVYNSGGKVVVVPMQGGVGHMVVGVSALPKGVYFLRIGKGGTLQTIKFLKE